MTFNSPRLETTALAWSLLMAGREASAVRAQRADDAKAAKAAAKKGGGKPASKAPRAAAPAGTPVADAPAAPPAPGATPPPTTRYPTFDELAAARGWKRDAGDTVAGMEEL